MAPLQATKHYHQCRISARRVGSPRRRRRKFIKYLKVRKRLLSPGAINFHLHFIFVSFVRSFIRFQLLVPVTERDAKQVDEKGCIRVARERRRKEKKKINKNKMKEV